MAFKKHSQENNKNLPALNEIEARLKSTKKIFKNHQRAKAKGTTNQKQMNPCIEQMYRMLVDKVKILCCSLPDKSDRVMIELDQQADPFDTSGIYCIMTPSIYLYLECDIKSNYRIEYHFHNCPIEKQVQEWINKLAIRAYSTDVVNQQDYPAFFNEVLRCQPERFIHLL
jgi:hypothetical protein